jgi:hypothetical protein
MTSFNFSFSIVDPRVREDDGSGWVEYPLPALRCFGRFRYDRRFLQHDSEKRRGLAPPLVIVSWVLGFPLLHKLGFVVLA